MNQNIQASNNGLAVHWHDVEASNLAVPMLTLHLTDSTALTSAMGFGSNIGLPALVQPAAIVFTDSDLLEAGVEDAVRWQRSRDNLFAIATLDESLPIAEAAAARYKTLLNLARRLGYPNPLRVWNFIPDINANENGEERYRSFNRGRAAAFAAAHLTTTQFSAATATGTVQPRGYVFWISTGSPVKHIENPHQVSAFNYPPEYGPAPPTFARASLITSAQRCLLFVSGTASILGHRSMHIGDVTAQMELALKNISAVTAAAKWREDWLRPLSTQTLLTAYVRRAADLPVVRGLLQRHSNERVRDTWLRADICRSELLVEIEAVLIDDFHRLNATH